MLPLPAARLPAVALFTAAFLTACGSSSQPRPRAELAWPITEPGRYRVAHQERTLTYSPRGVGGTRELRVVLWYPTNAMNGRTAKYMGELERPGVFEHAGPIDPGEGGFPILLFSHGNLSFAEQSYFLAEFFASHGFVVAAPDHTGNTLGSYGTPVTAETYLLRPLDLEATLDWLYALPKSDSLSGRLGRSVIAAGHSFGGYTTFAVGGARFPITAAGCAAMQGPSDYCANMTDAYAAMFDARLFDRRVKALLAFAPGGADVLGPEGVAAIELPVFLMTASGDKQTPNMSEGDPFWSQLSRESARRIDFARGGHHTFALTCELFPALGANDGCGDGFVDYREAHRLIDTYSLAFARRHLWSDPAAAAILDAPAPISSEISLFSRAGTVR